MNNTQRSLIGAKGANLAELARIEGVLVPPTFCIPTDADVSTLDDQIRLHLQDYPQDQAFAVRSSATAEDLPSASFAGQYDSFLNVIGADSVLEHVHKCRASLFNERAVLYRAQNNIDHQQVKLAVLIQPMINAEASGIMFTADPISGHRKVIVIEAGFGLGEAVVSGIVSPDHYKVRHEQILERTIAAKKLAIVPQPGGGTSIQDVPPKQQKRPALSDAQVLQLAGLGKMVENHFGRPQDIEWCLSQGNFYLVQSRPITTLFPIPEKNDENFHVYVSVGHQQMMTDAMKPLGLSVWLALAGRPMDSAAGRPFVDVAPELASPARRHVIVNVLGKSDPLIRDALLTILERGGIELAEDEGTPPPNYETMIDYDPELVPELIARTDDWIAELEKQLREKSGPELVDFIQEHIQESKKIQADPRSFAAIMTGMNAAYWLNDSLHQWLGEKNLADLLAQSVPNNVTSEMGLALLDVADAFRLFPEALEAPLDQLPSAPARATSEFLAKYGMRCPGEIDITRPRWSENPQALLPTLQSHLRSFQTGEAQRRFERGREQAIQKEQEVLSRLRQLPDGEQKASETSRMIQLLRNYAGYREFPKYGIVRRMFLYKQALLQASPLPQAEDIFYLTLEEVRQLLLTGQADPQLIESRKADFQIYQKLTPPRVMTSDGEILNGRYQRQDLPAGAVAGLAVSAGIVEGRARVLRSLEAADLHPGDILVTAYTDPSWTPLFVSIQGLVTEVGGLMTHGAVIAREYGLPAVVGVDGATRRIRDGQRIRVNGTEGYVQIVNSEGEHDGLRG